MNAQDDQNINRMPSCLNDSNSKLGIQQHSEIASNNYSAIM